MLNLDLRDIIMYVVDSEHYVYAMDDECVYDRLWICM